jgi:uncharacterized protein
LPITSPSRRGTSAGIRVAQLWRYPVKSLKGESLQSALLTPDGIRGDRVVHVAGPRGPLTGRTRHGLLTLPTATGPDRLPRVDGHPWQSLEALDAVRTHAGSDARLVADSTPERFDILSLLVATDGAVERLGEDVPRLRPNILLSGIAAELEPRLPGQAFAIGAALIGIHSVRQRCVVTTIDPDDGSQDLGVLRHIRDAFGGRLALNAWVIRPGAVRVGDEVRIVPAPEQPPRIEGWIVGAPYAHTSS